MHTNERRLAIPIRQTASRGAAVTDRTFDLNTWLETYKETVASFGKAQQDGFKALERFARFNYAKQAELSNQLSEKLRARAQEFSTLASDVQESVSNFAADAASRAAAAKKAA